MQCLLISTVCSKDLDGHFIATQVWSLDDKTFGRNRLSENLTFARCDPAACIRATIDHKHDGQAMCCPVRTAWIKSHPLERHGLWNQGVFQKVLRTSTTPSRRGQGFNICFDYKIQPKGGRKRLVQGGPCGSRSAHIRKRY